MTTYIESDAPKAALSAHYHGWTIIFALSFIAFMGIALTGQLLGWQWRAWLPGSEGAKSIFSGVKASVYTFMSYLT